MSDQSAAYKVLFKENITLLAQQKKSRLEDCVIVDSDFKGERKTYDQLSTIAPVEIMSRDQDTPSIQPDHRRRNVFPRTFVTNIFADKTDVYQMVSNPSSAYMMASIAGQNRQKDDVLIAAFNATAYIGKNGTTTQAFTAANQVAVTVGPGTATGLNKAKVLRAKRLLDGGEVDAEDRYAVISSIQYDNLLNITEIASVDFNSVKALVEGTVDRWLGFTFKRSERLGTSSGYRLCYFWQKMAMLLGIMQDIDTRIDVRPDKNYLEQVYTRQYIGATRMEEARIVEVSCSEA